MSGEEKIMSAVLDWANDFNDWVKERRLQKPTMENWEEVIQSSYAWLNYLASYKQTKQLAVGYHKRLDEDICEGNWDDLLTTFAVIIKIGKAIETSWNIHELHRQSKTA
jgi:hypothetical protein